MTYEVYLDSELLYYQNDETYSLVNAVVETALNEAGTFECDVPSNNPLYDSFKVRQSMIQVLKDGVEVFYGEVREVTQNFDFTRHIYAVGELAFLFDSIQPQYINYPLNMGSALNDLLVIHNGQVEDKKKFSVGNVISAESVYQMITNREDTLTTIREKLCTPYRLYLRIRKVGVTRYLDLVPLEQYGSYCTQEIQFGENLLDYACNYTSDSIATSVVPLGAKLDDENRTPLAVEGLDEYLTIATVNQGREWLDNEWAAARFGNIRVVKQFNDITDPQVLKDKGWEWLSSSQYETMTLEVSAIDLSLLDNSIDSFEVGDTVHVWAEPLGMDTTFPVQRKKINLNNLEENTITLSNTMPIGSYTSRTNSAISNVRDEIPEVASVLQQAQERAQAVLLDETQGGHVVYEYEPEGGIAAINICNGKTIEASTRRWRWSQNGFGYLWRNNINGAWSVPRVAMTMTGEIVADMITSGALNANIINGGILKLGGNDDGILWINDSSYNTIGRWDENGIIINKGQLNINNNFVVAPDGTVTMKKGVIQSANFKDATGNYSANGTKIDLASGLIKSKNFAIDSGGNAYYNGKLSAANITAGTVLKGVEILSKDTDKNYINIKEGDIFGGSSKKQHGYITFSALDGSNRGISLNGSKFINLTAGSLGVRVFGKLTTSGLLTANNGLTVNGALKVGNSAGKTATIAIMAPCSYNDGETHTSTTGMRITVTNGIITKLETL